MLDADIKFYLTGAKYDGDIQPDPALSLGGYRSSSEVSSTAMRNIFDHVTSTQSATGATEYRCIAVKNTHTTDTLSTARVWISSNTTSADTEVEIAVEQPLSQPTGQSQDLLSETEEPKGLDFYDTCVDYATGLSLGDLEAGQICYVWIKRTNIAGSQALHDSFTLNVYGIDEFADGVGMREHRVSSAHTPIVAFSKPTGSELRMTSTGNGHGYVMFKVPRKEIEDRTLRVTWDASPATDVLGYARIEVWDGEFDYSDDDDFPVGSYPPDNVGQGILQVVVEKTSAFSETDQDYTISLDTGDYDIVTVVFILNKPQIAGSSTLDIDTVSILNGTTTIATYPFDDGITSDRTGTYYDYSHMNMSDTNDNNVQSSYCITDIKTPSNRVVLCNNFIKIKSRTEEDDDSSCIDVWIKEDVDWDNSRTSELQWIYIGRIKPYLSTFDTECPWSRIYIHTHDFNKTILRFYFNDSVYMDLTLRRGAKHIQMQWASGLTGYTEFAIDGGQQCRFAYGAVIDATVASAGWNNFATTYNWCATFDDDHDYFIGMALSDNAVAPRCYVNADNDDIERLSLGASSALDNPHFIFYCRKIAESYYSYKKAHLRTNASIVADANSVEGYTTKSATPIYFNDGVYWFVRNICFEDDARLISRTKANIGDPYTYNDVAFGYGVTTITKYNRGRHMVYSGLNTYCDYMLYIPIFSEDAIGIASLGDVANEALLEWDYGIYKTDTNKNNQYDIKFTYDTITNDWSIEPDKIMVLPDVVDEIDKIPTSYRPYYKSFVNSIRKDAIDSTQATPANWSTVTNRGDSDSGSCLLSVAQNPGSIYWSVDIPDGYNWALIRLHAETGASMGYQARSDTVGTTYYEMKDLAYAVSDPETTITNQQWSYLEGYIRVSPGISNVIRIDTFGIGAINQATPRHIIDYIDVIPVKAFPVICKYRENVYLASIGAVEYLYNGSYTRMGTRIRYWDKKIKKVAFSLYRYGTMAGVDGNVDFVIRKVSDDSVIATVTYGLASTIAPTIANWYEVEFDTPIEIDEEVRILVEFSDGDASNMLVVSYLNAQTDLVNALCVYDGAWGEQTLYEASIKCDFENDPPNTVIVTFSDKLTENIWRNHYLSKSVKGRMTLKNMYVSSGIDMNQNLLIAPVAENRADFPITGDVFTFTFPFTFGEYAGVAGQIMFKTSDNKFYGYTGDEWIEL